MRIADRYAQAITSTNLRQREIEPGDADVLISIDWADRSLASVLHRCRASRDHTGPAVQDARRSLQAYTRAMAVRRQWDFDDHDLMAVVDAVLARFLAPHCRACTGWCFEPLLHSGRLSDAACAACHGTGLAPLRLAGATLDAGAAVEAEIARKLDLFGMRMSKSLRR